MKIEERKKGKGKRGFRKVLFAGFLLVVLGGAIFNTFSSKMHSREFGRREACRNNLRQIGVACQMYAITNEGVFPPDLQSLVPDIVSDEYLFVCFSALSKETIRYVYVPGLRPDSGPYAILAFDPKGNHNAQGRNVCFADGKVKWMDEYEFLKLLKAEIPGPHRKEYTEKGLLFLAKSLDEIDVTRPLSFSEKLKKAGPTLIRILICFPLAAVLFFSYRILRGNKDA